MTTLTAPWRAVQWVLREYWAIRYVDGVPWPPVISPWTSGFMGGATFGVYIWIRDANPAVALVFTTLVIVCTLGDRRAQATYAQGMQVGRLRAQVDMLTQQIGPFPNASHPLNGGDKN
jgi:hypothetical protein